MGIIVTGQGGMGYYGGGRRHGPGGQYYFKGCQPREDLQYPLMNLCIWCEACQRVVPRLYYPDRCCLCYRTINPDNALGRATTS